MRVGLLDTKKTSRARYLLRCFEAGVREHGDSTAWLADAGDLDRVADLDVCVQVCTPNRHAPQDFRVRMAEALRQAGKRSLVIDTGFVRSQPDYELAQAWQGSRFRGPRFVIKDEASYAAVDELIHYQVGYDGLKREADYCNAAAGGDRWKALRVPLVPWRRRGRHLVLIGQVLHGQSSQHIDIHHWYRDTLLELRRHTPREVHFRSHPRARKDRDPRRVGYPEKDLLQPLLGSIGRLAWSRNFLLEDDLQDAWAVVAFSSNAAVAAAVAGVPLFGCDPVCMAWPVANRRLDAVERPRHPDRQNWADRLAYAQWNAAEMRSGRCWQHFRPYSRR